LEPKSNYDIRILGSHLGKILFMTLARALIQSAAMVGLAVAAIGIVTSSGTARAQTWMLLGCEGGCVTLAETTRRESAVGSVRVIAELI
jgi:hypothetical protein